MDNFPTTTEIDGRFEPSLKQDAERFGGRDESTNVETYHVRITKADLAHLVETHEPIELEHVLIALRVDPPEYEPDGDLGILLSEQAVRRLAKGEIVNYGIRHVNGKNQTLHVSSGGISDDLGKEKPPAELLVERNPGMKKYV